MIEVIAAADLEVFLIRTLSPKERKFSPGKVRLAMSPVATFKWVSGDILVRRSTRVRNRFECTTVPMSELALQRGNLMEPPFRYNRVTIQRDGTGSGDCAGGEVGASLVGARFTYYADFAGSRSLEVVVQEDLPHQNEYWFKDLGMTLVPGYQCCIINNNKVETISASGKHTFVVLSIGARIQVKSFCPRDIIWGLGKTSHSKKGWPGFSLARPLTYFWTNEAFDFRVVADEVAENTSSQVADSEVTIDRALRYLVGRMLETRQAISDLIVDLMLEVAAELGTTHPTLDRLRHLRVQITKLHEIRRTHRLQPSLLEKLVEFDLKRVLPVFESDMQRLVTDMGTDFGSRAQQRFESMVSEVGLGYSRSFSLQYWNGAAQYMLLKVHQQIKQVTAFPSLDRADNNLAHQQIWSAKSELGLTKNNTPSEVHGYQAVLFHGLRCSETSVESGIPTQLAKIKAVLSESDGYVLRQQQLVCWKQTNDDTVGFDQLKTVFTLIDLGRLHQSFLAPDGQMPKGEWLVRHELEMDIEDPRCVCLERGTLYVLKLHEGDHFTLYVHSIKLTPEIEHLPIKLSKQITSLRCDWESDSMPGNPHQFCLSYSTKLGLLFLANISQGAFIWSEYDWYYFEIRLSASAIQRVGSESLVALTQFKETDLPTEIGIPWEFEPKDYEHQGVTPNTYGLPYSPLRWCITRHNAYCLWLLSPHSHIIFGFQNNRFVQLSRKLSYRSLCLNIPYVLPVFATDRVNGMIGLFKAKRTWDSKADCWMVTVYKLRLEQY